MPASPPDEPVPFVHIALKDSGFKAVIDAEDEELVQSLGPWHVEPAARRGYYDWRSHTMRVYTHGSLEGLRPDYLWGYRLVAPMMYLHDLIMGVGAGEEAFPANGDGTDCRKSNLRIRKVNARK